LQLAVHRVGGAPDVTGRQQIQQRTTEHGQHQSPVAASLLRVPFGAGLGGGEQHQPVLDRRPAEGRF
jgi:hypothetical protein